MLSNYQSFEYVPSVFTLEDFHSLRSIGNINKYKKRETILLPESPYRYIYMLCQGVVKVYRLSKRGKEKIVRLLKPYDIFGEYALLGEGISYESVEAMEDCEILMINRADFKQALIKQPDFFLKFTQMLLTRNIDLENHLAELVFRDVSLRAIRNLVELAKKYGLSRNGGILLDIKITQYELGNLIGATRETTSTVLNQFKKDGLIDFNGRKIIITNIEKMYQLLRKEEEAAKQSAARKR
ncbi:MAG: Crp/Fnr family transcriptional regulator [Acidobacteria bacterium]|nr:Crp/Fnr family transcriptional regulator [Acidobacteriota bacterium]